MIKYRAFNAYSESFIMEDLKNSIKKSTCFVLKTHQFLLLSIVLDFAIKFSTLKITLRIKVSRFKVG